MSFLSLFTLTSLLKISFMIQGGENQKRRTLMKMYFAFRYIPPEAGPDSKEEIIVKKVAIADETKKREIYVFSDLHLGGDWSTGTVDELKEFLITLAKIAEEYVHTIVMLGDVLEMWMTPITVTPASKEELVKQWKNHKVTMLYIFSLLYFYSHQFSFTLFDILSNGHL